MKAITCPQCGALLEDISLKENIARCDYCRAKILIRPIGENKDEFEVSLVTRAEGKEDTETYQRGNLTFTKQKYQPNDTLRLAYLSQRTGERMRTFGLFGLILAIVIFVFLGIYLNSNL